MLTVNATQSPADAAVVIPTILRPSLVKAVRSVFTQNFDGRIHLLIGVDIGQGDCDVLDLLAAKCPPHVMMTVVDPGYSTSQRHGGVHSNHFGGSLRTALSYLANSRYVAYLDDNDWWGANHLGLLKTAIAGKPWAWSGRWMAHPDTGWPICRDEWDSVGPGKGINAERFGGFVQPSGLMMDLRECHFVMPLWALAAFDDGTGEDRLIFDQLTRTGTGGTTGQFTSFCTLTSDTLSHDHHRREFLARGLNWVFDESLIFKINTLFDTLNACIEVGDWSGAAPLTDAILALNPHHARTLHARALIARAERRFGDGLAALSHALEVDDSHPAWTVLMAELLNAVGNTEAAARAEATRLRRFGL